MRAQDEGRIDTVAYEPAHLEALLVQAGQAGERMAAEPEALEGRWSRSVFAGNQLVACAGIAPIWPGRAFAWAFVGAGFPRAGWPALTRATRAQLDDAQAAGYRRLETSVAADFGPGVRWVLLLGFRVEGLMRAWLGGRDYLLYARVAPEAGP